MAKKQPRGRSGAPTALPNVSEYTADLASISNDLANRYVYKNELKSGKTGMAYRLGLVKEPSYSVCLKTIRPDITDSGQRQLIAQTLAKEVEILRTLSHRCLPRILEDGTKHSVQPYYICTFHPGRTCTEVHASQATFTVNDSAFVVFEFIDVIRYAHEHGRTHCDLHGGNVLIGSHPLRDGLMVIDFGSGHRASDTTPVTPNKGNAGFKPQDSLRHDRLPVVRSDADQDFRKSDIIALGKLLIQMEDSFMSAASPLVREEYRQFCSRLDRGEIDSFDKIVEQCRTVFDPIRCLNENGDLFLLGDAQRAEITLPVVGSVRVGTPSLEVINTPEFQRLRMIKQLSFCDWHFPGAVHSRFEHALGVYELACQAIHNLAYQSNFRRNCTSADVRAFLLAALVHDIGHYPFAHAVEQYAASRFVGEQAEAAKKVSHHETYTHSLLVADGRFRQAVIKAWGRPTVDRAIQILSGDGGMLSSMLDGPLDIDKMDYLSRDAYHAGLSFAGQQNPRALCSILEADKSGSDIHGHQEDLPLIEGFVLLQDQLYGALYWHPVVRSVHAMFQAIIAHIVGKNLDKLRECVARLQAAVNEHEAVVNVLIPRLKESELIRRENTRERLVIMAEAIRSPDYSAAYRLVHTYRHDDPNHRIAPINVYRSIVLAATETGTFNHIAWNVATKLRTSYLTAIRQHVLDVTDADILIDIPFGKGAKRLGTILDGNGQPVRIDKVTHLKQTAFEQPVVHWSPIRVFVAPEHVDVVDAHSDSVRARAEEEFFQTENPKGDSLSPI